jgi:hypothetical protein
MDDWKFKPMKNKKKNVGWLKLKWQGLGRGVVE